MQYASVKKLIRPLIKSGHEWQFISVNGIENRPRCYFSDVQWLLLLFGGLILFKLNNGISKDIIGYVMSAFSISVSLFMSLLVSIFDKFENTTFEYDNDGEEEMVRLKQKKNFFKRFISITSSLVILSIVVIILCSLSFVFNLPDKTISYRHFTLDWQKINIALTVKNGMILAYRILLNYMLLNYLFLTFFITGSAFEYYMSELNRRKITKKQQLPS